MVAAQAAAELCRHRFDLHRCHKSCPPKGSTHAGKHVAYCMLTERHDRQATQFSKVHYAESRRLGCHLVTASPYVRPGFPLFRTRPLGPSLVFRKEGS